jgi:cell division transport system permease protein
MIRTGRFLRQVSRHMKREKRLSLGSFLVLAIVLMLVDLFWIASGTINNEYRKLLSNVRMEVFLSDTIPDSALTVVKNALESFDGVSSIDYISKDDAARQLETQFGSGILDGLDQNPLPRSFVLHFDHLFHLGDLDAMESRLERLRGVDGVEFGRPWIQKIEHSGRLLQRIGIVVGALILFIVLLTMANTNRLTARTKSRDFFQLKLLGAGPSYVLYPFLAEGLLSAIIAAGLGWVLVYYLARQVSFTTFALVLPDIRDIVIYSLVAGLTGMVGAYLGIRRLLIS